MATLKYNIYNDSIILVTTDNNVDYSLVSGSAARIVYYSIPSLLTSSETASEDASANKISIHTDERYHMAIVNHVLFNLTNKQVYYDLYNDEVRKCRRDSNRSKLGQLKQTQY